MPNRVVLFNSAAEATAYRDACNADYAARFEPGGTFAYLRQDAQSHWVTPYYGPPWEFIGGEPFNAPPEIEALCVGEIVDTVTWPED